MPIHDWTRVDAGTFHAFHVSWVSAIQEALNDGLLPCRRAALGAVPPAVMTMGAMLGAVYAFLRKRAQAVADGSAASKHSGDHGHVEFEPLRNKLMTPFNWVLLLLMAFGGVSIVIGETPGGHGVHSRQRSGERSSHRRSPRTRRGPAPGAHQASSSSPARINASIASPNPAES